MARLHVSQLLFAAVASVSLITAVSPARVEAATIGFSTAASLIDKGQVDWSTYGAEFDPVPNGTTKAVPGIPGVNLTISETAGFDFLRVTEGLAWVGNFTIGDPVLYTTGGGPIDYIFSSPIAGFGSQIQSFTFGAFTARLEAFDSLGTSLGFFALSGNSNQNEDGSAIFLGLRSTALDISRVRLSLTAAQPDGFGSVNLGDFAVNDPRLTDAPIPEPVTLVLFGTGLMGIAVARLRRKSRAR